MQFRAHHEERTIELHETRKQLKLLRSWGVSQEKEAKEAVLLIDVVGRVLIISHYLFTNQYIF